MLRTILSNSTLKYTKFFKKYILSKSFNTFCYGCIKPSLDHFIVSNFDQYY